MKNINPPIPQNTIAKSYDLAQAYFLYYQRKNSILSDKKKAPIGASIILRFL